MQSEPFHATPAGAEELPVTLPRSVHVFRRLTGTTHYHLGYFDDGEAELDRALDRLALLDTEHLDADAPLLDAGCGMGGTSALLADRGFTVFGFDPSARLIAFACADAKPGARVRYHVGGLEDHASRGPGSFGSVVMIEVTQHFKSLAEALSIARRSLRPGGRVLVKDVFTDRRHPRERVPYHPRNDVEAAVAKAGLEVIARRDITANVVKTLPMLNKAIERERGGLGQDPGERWVVAQLDELESCLAVMATAFETGDINYESLVLERPGRS